VGGVLDSQVSIEVGCGDVGLVVIAGVDWGDEDVRWKSDPEATNSGSSEMLPEMPVWLEHAPPYAGPPGL
jgi:hypothetical protein